MSSMDFFRRPHLTGKNLTRVQSATVRGSVRRADADGTSAEPYFPSVTGSFPLVGALTLKVDGVAKSVTLNNNKFKDTLDAINTALGASGTALDTDGSISIRTATVGGTGSVEMTGGTVAAGLGFDIALRPLRSVGGELTSTPEGRKGNPFGAAFPMRGEDLTIESIQRSIGRIAANNDVLFSDHMRGNAVLRKVPFTIDAGRTFITPPASTRIFTGGPLLFATRGTTKNDGVTSVAPSNVVQLFVGSGFSPEDTGNLLKIESGPDIGTYVIAAVLGPTQLAVSKLNGSSFAFSASTGLQYAVYSDDMPLKANKVATALPNGISKDRFAPYFFLLDKNTNQAAPCHIVGITRGAPVGNSYLTDSPSWTDTTGKNVLGQDLVKLTGIAISGISEGRFLTCSAATFITSGVVDGDYVDITGALNTVPWSNNGYRWVIERVISETQLEVRPMSKSEMDQLGLTFIDVQPVLELNDVVSGSFGTLSVRTGIATSGVNLVCSPALQDGADYELYAALPVGMREERTWEQLNNNFPASLLINNDLDPAPNCILSFASAIIDGGPTSIRVPSFYARWHGKIVKVPQAPNFTPLGVNSIVYWDEKTCSVKLVADPAPSSDTTYNGYRDFNPANSQTTTQKHIISKISDNGVTVTAQSVVKIGQDNTRSPSIPVGRGCQFISIEAAINHLNALAALNLESPSGISGAVSGTVGQYLHGEIVLVNDTEAAVSNNTIISIPGLVIRGANKDIRLRFTGNPFRLTTSNCSLTIKDITLRAENPNGALVVAGADNCNVHLDNIDVDMTTGGNPLRTLLTSTGAHSGNRLSVTNSRAVISGGVCWAPDLVEVTLLASVFTQSAVGGAVNMQVIGANISGASSDPSFLTTNIADCRFENLNSSSSFPMFIRDGGGKHFISNCYFGFDPTLATSDSVLFQFSNGTARLNGITVDGTSGDGTVNQAIAGNTSHNVHVANSSFVVRPSANNSIGVQAATAVNCTITCVDTVATFSGKTALEVSQTAIGNRILGPTHVGIQTTSVNVVVAGNQVDLSAGANAGNPTRGIFIVGNNSMVTDNRVSLTGGGVAFYATGVSQAKISSNRFNAVDGGIDTLTVTSFFITGNEITTTANSSFGIRFGSASVTHHVLGNSITTPHNASASGIKIITPTSSVLTLFNNNITSWTVIDTPSTNCSFVARGNFFIGEASTSLSGEFSSNTWAGNFNFSGDTNVVGNRFGPSTNDSTCLVALDSDFEHINFANNSLTSNTRLEIAGDTATTINITGNYIDSSLNVTSGADLGNTVITGNRINNNGMNLSPANGDKSVTLSGNFIQGSITIGTKVKHLVMDACDVGGSVTRSAPASGGSTRIDGIHVTSTTTIQGDGVTFVNSLCDLDTKISGGTLSTTDYGATISSCLFHQSLQVEGKAHVANCHVKNFMGIVAGSTVPDSNIFITGCDVEGFSSFLGINQFTLVGSTFRAGLSLQGDTGNESIRITNLVVNSNGLSINAVTAATVEGCTLNDFDATGVANLWLVDTAVTTDIDINAGGNNAAGNTFVARCKSVTLSIVGTDIHIEDGSHTTVITDTGSSRYELIRGLAMDTLTMNGWIHAHISECEGKQIILQGEVHQSSISYCRLSSGSVANVQAPCIDIASDVIELNIIGNNLRSSNNVASNNSGNSDQRAECACIRVGHLNTDIINMCNIQGNTLTWVHSTFVPVVTLIAAPIRVQGVMTECTVVGNTIYSSLLTTSSDGIPDAGHYGAMFYADDAANRNVLFSANIAAKTDLAGVYQQIPNDFGFAGAANRMKGGLWLGGDPPATILIPVS